MAPRSVTNTPPRTAPPVRRKVALVNQAPAPRPVRQDRYAPTEVIGQVVMLPVNAVLFVGNASLMLAKLLMFKVTHPFQLDVPRVITWVNQGMRGEPPTTDPDMLAMLIRTQNPGFADLMSGYIVDHPQAKPDVVAVMRWAIATQGKGLPPTDDARLLASLIGLKAPELARELDAYVAKHPNKAGDAAALEQWLIASGGKPSSVPPRFNPALMWILAKYAWR